MEILKFTLSGQYAIFTRPYFNSYYSTYSHIHKVALLGFLGSMIGIRRKKTEDGILLFYNELESLKISIVPHKLKFPEVRDTRTETTGMFNDGNTYVNDYMQLCNPAWDIYVYGNNNKNYEKIKEFVTQKKSVFNIYLGKNENFANLSSPKVLDAKKISREEQFEINGLFIKDEVVLEQDENNLTRFYFRENMPVGMDRRLNQYSIKEFLMTDDIVVKFNSNYDIIRCDNRNLFLF